MSIETKNDEEFTQMDIDQSEIYPLDEDEQFLNRLAIQHKVLTELVKPKERDCKTEQNNNLKELHNNTNRSNTVNEGDTVKN